MNENTIKGDVKTGLGKAEGAAGDVLGDRELQVKGGATQVEGRAQNAVGSAQQAIGQVADQARDAASRVADQAKDAYGRVSDQAQAVREVVDPFVKAQPYAGHCQSKCTEAGFASARPRFGGSSRRKLEAE